MTYHPTSQLRMFSTFQQIQDKLLNPLTHLGGPIGPPLFKRPVAQKVIKLKKFRKISYSTEIILALKLSTGVSSKKAVLYK
jgi:hypothetical protein